MSNRIKAKLDSLGFTGTSVCLEAPAGITHFETPIFFYHIHKAAGNAIRLPHIISFQISNIIHPEKNFHAYIHGTRDVGDPSPQPDPERRYLFAASNARYGDHERYSEKFALITVVRDPLRRIFSDYQQDAILQKQKQSVEGFQTFIRDSKNICLQCQHLSRLDIDKEGPKRVYEDAIENLNDFSGYTTTEDIEALLQNIWGHQGNINVITTRINQNTNIDLFINYDDIDKEEVLELNSYDVKLFEYVKKHKKLPFRKKSNKTVCGLIYVAQNVDTGYGYQTNEWYGEPRYFEAIIREHGLGNVDRLFEWLAENHEQLPSLNIQEIYNV